MKRTVVAAATLLFSTSLFASTPAQMGGATQYYLHALLLESQGNLVAAQEELQKALSLAPDSAYLHRTSAELSLRLGQVNVAAEEIDKANDLDPTDVKALVLAGQIHWALGNAEKAEAKLKRAVELDPDQAEAIVSLAGALTPKNPKEAIRLYKDFLVRHPGSVEIVERLAQLYQASGNPEAAKASWEQALELSPTSLRAHLALAQIAEVNFDTATAISHYEAVMTEDPTNLALLLRVGELRYRNNEMAEATEAFSKAHALAPSSASANFWLALLAERRGDWEEAIRLLKQVAAQANDPGVLLRLSYYYSQAGKFGEAIKVLKQLSDSAPTNTDFLSYLAIAYEQDKQYGNAEKALQRVSELDPQDPEARFQLATLYDRTHQFQKAEQELKAAINLKPDYHAALNYLGYSYADRNTNLDEAEKLVQSAIALDPHNAAYLDSMGWVYYRQGKLQKAAEFIQEASRRASDPLIWDHLGDIQISAGDPEQAVLAWDESMRLDPESKSVAGKIDKALRQLSPGKKVGFFVKRSVNHFSDLQSVNGLIQITVCEKKPCFESKAQLGYMKGGEFRIEVSGPLMGPVMLLTKQSGQPAKYGAIHPLFQTVEYYVTRACDRIQALLSSEALSSLDQVELQKNAVGKGRALSSHTDKASIVFDESSGAVQELGWTDGQESETLKIAPYGPLRSGLLPKSVEWRDNRTGFFLRIEFLNPVVSTVPPVEADDSDQSE